MWGLTLAMLGPKDNPTLHAKAAETHGLLGFIVWILQKNLDRVKALKESHSEIGQFLLAAGQNAMQFDKAISKSERKLSNDDLMNMFTGYKAFIVLFERAGGNLTPKCHLMFHCIFKAAKQGNPRYYSTYRDESLNGTIAAIARSCHRRAWAEHILWKISIAVTLELPQVTY